jgi:hypothetical protein
LLRREIVPTIKLPPIPVEEMIPVRFTMPGSKHAELLEYLAYFNESHRSEVDLKALLPHLVAAYLADDRSFARWRNARSAPSERAPTEPAPSKRTRRPPRLVAESS